MGRPRQFDESEAIEAAMIVFWIKGYAGTNLPDLLAAMSLTRGSFYKAFDDKHAVYLRALDYYDATRMGVALTALSDRSAKPPRQRLIEFFQRTEYNPGKPAPKIGCFVCNTMVEMAPFDPECATRCEDIADRLTATLRTVLDEMLPDGPSALLDRKAAALQRLYMGSHTLGRTGTGFAEWPELLDDILGSPRQ